MQLDLTDLRLFIRIAEAASLTQGARHASISPAAASARIKVLEAQLSSPLLHRHSRGVALTNSGQYFLKRARLILRQVDYLSADLGQYRTTDSGVIRIFANATAVPERFPEILSSFCACNPNLTIEFQEGSSGDVVQGVCEGAADVGIISGEDANGLQVLRFSAERLVVVVPIGHPLAANRSCTLQDTVAFRRVVHRYGNALEAMDSQVEDVEKRPTQQILVSSFDSMCRMVEAGVGIGVLPESAAIRRCGTMALRIIHLDHPGALIQKCLLVKNLETLPSPIRALISAFEPEAIEYRPAPDLEESG